MSKYFSSFEPFLQELFAGFAICLTNRAGDDILLFIEIMATEVLEKRATGESKVTELVPNQTLTFLGRPIITVRVGPDQSDVFVSLPPKGLLNLNTAKQGMSIEKVRSELGEPTLQGHAVFREGDLFSIERDGRTIQVAHK